MAKAYDVAETWAGKCTDMQAKALPGGHFFVDCAPDETARALKAFLA